MLRRNNGYFLVELLLSLSTWIIVTGVLLPLYLHLQYQTDLLQLENTALHLLFDELENKLDNNLLVGNKSIVLNGNLYEIKWYENTSKPEVCVEYKDLYSNVQKTCRNPE
jgi:competence protein ComGE